MLKDLYASVMDPERNPLRSLPKMQRFQYMVVLSYMWSTIFAISVGSYLVFGASVVAHLLLLTGLFFTRATFGNADQLRFVRWSNNTR